MSTIKILAGDFKKGVAQYSFGSFSSLKTDEHWFLGETLPINGFSSVELANEESVRKLGAIIGWGAVGALVLGPIGLLAGLALAGKDIDVTFIAIHKDGRAFMASTDSNTYSKIQAALF